MKPVVCPQCSSAMEIVHWPYAKCVGFMRSCGLYRLDDDDGQMSGVPLRPTGWSGGDSDVAITLGPLLTTVSTESVTWTVPSALRGNRYAKWAWNVPYDWPEWGETA